MGRHDGYEREKRTERALRHIHEARRLAALVGLTIEQKTLYHFQLKGDRGDGDVWIINLYPSTRVVHYDPRHTGPHLRLPQDWTLIHALNAAVEATHKSAIADIVEI